MLSKDELLLVSQRMSRLNEKLFRSMRRPLPHPYADYTRWHCKRDSNLWWSSISPGGVISKTSSTKQIFTQHCKTFISRKVASRLEPLKMNMSTDAVLLRWKCKHDFLSVLFWPSFHRAGRLHRRDSQVKFYDVWIFLVFFMPKRKYLLPRSYMWLATRFLISPENPKKS